MADVLAKLAAGNPFSPTVTWYATLVLLTLAVVISVPWAIRVWKDARGELGEDGDTAEGLLGPLEEAYASGQMSEEEYHRIRTSVGKVAPPGRLSHLSIPPRPARPVGEEATPPPEETPRPPSSDQ